MIQERTGMICDVLDGAFGVALGVALDIWETKKKYQHYFIL